MTDPYVLNWWQVATLLYLACGVLMAIASTTEEMIEWYREDPAMPRDPVEEAITLVLFGLVITVVWPAVISFSDDDEE